MLKCVTFTGIDERVCPDDVIALHKLYPFIEFGVLVSTNHTGFRTNQRYPDMGVLEYYKDKGLNLSCHVCGSAARQIMQEGDWSGFYSLVGEYKGMFQRIQLNVSRINRFSSRVTFPESHKVIIQLNTANTAIFEAYKERGNVLGFQDNSGGRGVYKNTWMKTDEKYFGYAGGICVDNVDATVRAIMAVNSKDFWIDMESSVRTDDWLSIEKCAAVAELCSKFVVRE